MSSLLDSIVDSRISKFNIAMENQREIFSNPQKAYELDVNSMKNSILTYYSSQKKKLIENKYIDEIPLSIQEYYRKNNIPKESKLKEKIFTYRKEKRQELEREFKAKYEKEYLRRIEFDNRKRKYEYESELRKKNDEIANFNKLLDVSENLFKSGSKMQVEEIFNKYFKNFVHIQFDQKNYDVKLSAECNSEDKTLCVKMMLFSPSLIRKTAKAQRYIRRTGQTETIYYSENEINKMYEGYVYGTAVYLLYTISYTMGNSIEHINLNAYVQDINPCSGNMDELCVLSVLSNCTENSTLNIKTVEPKSYLRSLGARMSKKMVELEVIEPIKIINHKKNRITDYTGIRSKTMIDVINNDINGFEFEKLSGELLLKNGFDEIEVTKSSGDYGADIIAYKDDVKYAIQCKKYASKVGVRAIQEVIASKSVYNCHVAVVLTNNYFTPNAQKLAKENNVLLWDKDRLTIMIEKMKKTN